MVRTSAKIVAIAVLGGLAFAFPACGELAGTTPSCTNNATDDAGIVDDSNGCDQFAACLDDKGDAQDAATFCCAGSGDSCTDSSNCSDNEVCNAVAGASGTCGLGSSDFAICMFGYGQGPAPSPVPPTGSGGGGAGGGTTTTGGGGTP